MARNTSTAQANTLGQSNYWVTARAWIQDIDGNWRNLSHPADTSPPNYQTDPGQNWLEGISHNKGDDNRVEDLTAFFSYDQTGGISLSPLMEDSSANVDSGASYGALLDAGRLFRIEVATTPVGSNPSESDFEVLFFGEVDRVDFDRNPIEVIARDQGAHLEDRWVEDVTEYGSTSGIAIGTVMQTILDDWTDGVTLYTPNGSPFSTSDVGSSIVVDAYEQERMPVMEALQVLAGRIGYDLRYRWHNGSSDFQLVLSEPDRNVSSPDYTFGASQYFDVNTLAVDRTHVRNAVVVYWQDEFGIPRQSSAKSTGSIARFGRRYMAITEGEGSPINTASEAQALANAALADLEEPFLEQEIRTQFDWRIELNDYIRHTANSVHYSTAQNLAVVGVRHELASTSHMTFIRVRGKPAGAYRNWTTRFETLPNEIVLNSWEWVPENTLTGTSSTGFTKLVPAELSALELHIKPLAGVRSISVTVTGATGELGTDVLDLTSAGIGGVQDFTYRYAAGVTARSTANLGHGALFRWGSTGVVSGGLFNPGNYSLQIIPYAATGGSTGGGGAGQPIDVQLGAPGGKGWGVGYREHDGTHHVGTVTHLRPFFQIAESTAADGLTQPRLQVKNVYDSGVHGATAGATWTPDYANGPAQYRFFQRDCEIQLPATVSSVQAETFHLYIDANGYTISFAEDGYMFPGGIASPVNLTHGNWIVNHQGKLSGVVLPNMLDGGVNLGV